MDFAVQTQLTKALDLLLDVICFVDAEGRFVAVSGACEQVFGYRPEEMIGQPFIDMVHPEDRERTLRAAAGVMSGEPLRNFETRYLRKDGQVVDIMWSARWSESDRLRLAVAREVTQRKRAESMQAVLYGISEAAHSADDLSDLFPRIHQIVGAMLPIGNFFVALCEKCGAQPEFCYVVDSHTMKPAVCRQDAEIMVQEIVCSGAALLLTSEARGEWPAGMSRDVDAADWLGIPLTARQEVIGALVVQSHAPEVRYNEQHKTLLQFVSAQIAANIERKQASARLRYMAQYDILTGLPNRILFDDRLQVALARAARAREKLALLYIDLDDFKPVNDSFGHAVGDLLLQEVASRIQGCVRDSDTVSRIGGDEFLVLLNAIHAQENAVAVAENIRAALRQVFELAGRRLQIASSIGIAIYPQHGIEQKQLTRNADSAMYTAKNRGGNQCLMFEE